jgi:two-component system phosphate regulon sensor histidine kinase PhoR
MLGLIFTQSFWIREEINLSRSQYDHRVDNALQDVIRELTDFNDSASRFTPWMNACPPPHTHKNILDVLDTTLLDALIKKYTDYHQLDKYYYYAIVKTTNDSVVYHSPNFPAGDNMRDSYKACLSTFWKDAYYHLSITFPQKNKAVMLKLGLWLALTLTFLVIIIYSVAMIIITYLRQKKLTEMKNDFINNITHEFKTPVSTIALATEVLMKSDSKSLPDRVNRYARMIHDENERMRLQVERVLEVAQQDYHEIKLNPVEIDVHQLLNSIVPNLCLEKSSLEVKVHFRLDANHPVIEADLMFITSIFSNITENAIKYSGNTPEINIISCDHKEGVMVSFVDNGIGMSRESMKHIFEKFYRVPTGNVHNVKGFGLGLYYAKTMVDIHGGFIQVSGELNKGSRFDVYLPAKITNSSKKER